MGCSPFENSRFQMGVTEMGFAEDFGLTLEPIKIMKQMIDHIYSKSLRYRYATPSID